MARTKNTKRGKKKLPVDENKVAPDQPAQDGKNPENNELEDLLDQADRLLISSDFEKAKHLSQQVLDIHNNHPRALETLALTELELGEIQSARKLFQKSLNHSKSNPQPTVHLYLAQLSNSPKEALSHFKKALDLLKAKLNEILQSKKKNTRSILNPPRHTITLSPILFNGPSTNPKFAEVAVGLSSE